MVEGWRIRLIWWLYGDTADILTVASAIMGLCIAGASLILQAFPRTFIARPLRFLYLYITIHFIFGTAAVSTRCRRLAFTSLVVILDICKSILICIFDEVNFAVTVTAV
jgi:hypothetical protein